MTISPDTSTKRDGVACLLAPRSIAIIGVSQDFNKLNGRVMKFLLEKGYEGEIFPINPKYQEVGGRRCYPSISDLPGPVDLAVLSIPARMVADELENAGRQGVRAAVVFSSGFGEMGEEGKALEEQILDIARRHDIRLCGPNTLGLINSFEKVYATFTQFGMGETPSGPIGFVTQSGAFGTAIAALARRRGLGLGYFVNTGNESDVTFADVATHVMADERIRVGAGYIEGLKDGPGFVEVAKNALEAGKPFVVTKVGRTASGARAAASHTGSLAGEHRVFEGISNQFGVCRARNEEQMLDLVDMFSTTPVPRGRRVAIITQSGGAGVLMTDRAADLGLEVPDLAPTTKARLAEVLPSFAALGNPVDVTAQFISDPSMLKESVKAVLADPNIDIAAIWLQLMDGFVEPLTQIFRELLAETEKPFVVAWVAAPEHGLKALRDLGICTLRGGEPVIDAIDALCTWGTARDRWAADAPARAARVLPDPGLSGGRGQLGSDIAGACLEAAGVPLARARLAKDAEAAVTAADTLGYPVALKIESPDIAHKTELDGVEIGLADADAVRAAGNRILARARELAPNARLSGLLVQEMKSGTVDLVVGLRNDPVFGMVVMVGLGGILVEVLEDVAFRKAPVTEAEADEMLSRLRGAAILDGVRGKPGVDRAMVSRFIARVSEFGAANAAHLEELDLNPVLAGPEEIVAVDWLLVEKQEQE
ncbi:acetate--CoA ligase family protein [Oceaniglobus ichthyenteri]|uniref:acetate--CoA ligase family protein n=1 Tax=Oceaniglobus ichthyenteri TaxID=2136177 RepID=UPI000D33AE09|nr:acetate--CoA ligase family protein [Oceaniglobus ichthyenteri]